MIARSLLLMQGLEAALYLALIARAAIMTGGLSVWAAVGGVAAFALGWRLLLIALMYQVAFMPRVARPAEARIGLAAGLYHFLREYFSFLRVFLIDQPLEPWRVRRDAPKDAPHKGSPILLIHGFSCNAGYWPPLMRALEARGMSQLYTINLEPQYGDIERFAGQVAARVEAIRAATGAARVTLIGHSMGGLVSRCYVLRHGGAEFVDRIISLGSPHHGTRHAYFSRGLNARQMRPGKGWLAALNAEWENERDRLPPLTSIYSYHDNLVTPPDSAHVPGAENHALPGVGHLRLCADPKVQALVLQTLAG